MEGHILLTRGSIGPRKTVRDVIAWIINSQLRASQVDPKDPARTDRVSASIAIHVSWTDTNGNVSSVEAKTITICRAGATIELGHVLNPPQEITISETRGVKDVMARVLGVVGKELERRIYNVVFVGPEVQFWDRQLPGENDSETIHTKAYLECGSCSQRAIVSLSEIEFEVLTVNRLTHRLCETCGSWTAWGFPDVDASPEQQNEPSNEHVAEHVEEPPRVENRRKKLRIRVRFLACLRRVGGQEEVVHVEDASGAGFRFVSNQEYREGSEISAAMPYSTNATNVFVPARVVWRREASGAARFEYGVIYRRKPKSGRW